MKYWFGLPVVLVAAGALFTACGDESATELVKAESYASGEDLPTCDASYKGYFAVVSSENAVYVCAETQKDGAKAWEWKSVGGSAPTAPAVTKFDCKAEELADKSGYKLVCNGDSLAVIKNGTKGEKGENAEAPETNPGCTVENLEDGSGVKFTCGDKSVEVKTGEPGKTPESSNGSVPESSNGGVSESSSSAAITPETLEEDNSCSVVYAGADVLVYDCGNGKGFAAEAYVTSYPTWKGLSRNPYIMKKGSGVAVRPSVGRILSGLLDGGDGEGAFLVDNDVYYAGWSASLTNGADIVWEGVSNSSFLIAKEPYDGETPTPVDPVMEESLNKNYGLKGKATLTVPEDLPNGVLFSSSLIMDFYDGHAATAGWGGFCLTYSSEKEMNIYIGNNNVYFRLITVIPSTNGQEKTINIPWNKFKIPGAERNLDASINEYYLNTLFYGDEYTENGLGIQIARFALVESDKAGTYENNFGIFEFGAYGKCSGNTITKLKADVALLKKEGTFTDPNDESVIYNTVTIGYDTWFVENQNIIPVAEEVGSSSSDALYSSSEQAQYTCLDGEACERVGYTFDAAQNLCPEGTHVATGTDWMNLIMAVSEKYYAELYGSDIVTPLMSLYEGAPTYGEFAYSVLASQTDWEEGNEGWNLLGFNLTPSINVGGVGGTLFWTLESEGHKALVAKDGDLVMKDVDAYVNVGAVRCVLDRNEYLIADKVR